MTYQSKKLAIVTYSFVFVSSKFFPYQRTKHNALFALLFFQTESRHAPDMERAHLLACSGFDMYCAYCRKQTSKER